MLKKMTQLLNHFIVGLLSTTSLVSFGQKAIDGIYHSNDTLSKSNTIINKMTLIIKGDSIWFSENKKPETSQTAIGNFSVYKGTIHKFKDFYIADLILMECDTCPAFWKYTTKPEDSIGIEVLYSSDKTDTIVTNRDTSLQRMEVLSDKAGNIEVRRMAELFLRTTKNHDLLVDGKLYRRTKSK